ncbi:MAG: hypothetical protein HY763_12485 [Planctomycetes bacterium]|nr:hypothetical protein [Planctomycetota bacterium]
MKLPVQNARDIPPRSGAEVRALALAVQANLVMLRLAECRRRGIAPEDHEIQVAPPGAVRALREMLLAPETISALGDPQLHLLLHEVWGQFCLLLWLFSQGNTADASLAHLPEDAEMHCATAIEAKLFEVHAVLWRMLFELRLRHDAAYAASPACDADRSLGEGIPAQALGKPVAEATNEEIIVTLHEYVGMLVTLRWVLDPQADWFDPHLREVAEKPF